MPRAGDGMIGQFPIDQWATVMGADIVDCVERAPDVKQGNHFAVDFN
jgi:hypothetical protein